MTSIAIIDIIGLPYDGTTVFRQGLGGSESAVTYQAKELARWGFQVTVFNNCDIDDACSGIYDSVQYLPLTALAHDHYFDIVISSRTIIPFVDPDRYNELNDNRAWPLAPYNLYEKIVRKAKMRILWMHDTFCLGDNLIEELAVEDRITDIFTLSDFHLTYVANCHHGRRRNFEVLKPKLFITRNGAYRHIQEVDFRQKDRNLFVYNASVTKGMVPLVNEVWPIVKANIPDARLVVIGGYYRFSSTSAPDKQEQDWRAMVADPKYTNLGIEFKGVIPQREIAEILSQANFMIYPCEFPETYGISTLESLLYNTPVLTCRFGALEEIALEGASYLLDYAVVPNGLFPDINRSQQVIKFAEMVIGAYNNPYLHQQKQYYCNIIKDIAGWDSVALQWKQLFYRRLGLYLNLEEYRQVSKINRKVHRIWKRRFTNVVEFEHYKANNEQPIVVVSTFYNCARYIERCINSVATQDYDNYVHILINDASTDNTAEVVAEKIASLPDSIRSKFHVINNEKNVGAVCNQVTAFRSIANPESIVMILDGDDSLINDNTIFSYYNMIYDGSTEFTYGSCWSMVDNIPLISQPYPEAVKQNRSYRQHHFNWILPYTHLRTFKQYLIKDIPDSAFQDESGQWYRAGGDGSTFYNLIEAAEPDRVKCLAEIVYNYNDASPLNDYKVNGVEQNINARKIINREPTQMNSVKKKKILIAIPTARNIEAETFKSIYDLEIPDGYEAQFQYFYGYNIDQVRNLIADWVVKGFDYLFSVDSDIAFPKDTLKKLLSHDRDMVTGLYIQRKPGEHILEVYEHNGHGGVVNIPYGKIRDRGLVEIASCGFGCVLVKAEVMRAIPYPHFKYHSAIDHKNTISEDVDFCRKAINRGFKMYADTSIQCRHIGSTEFVIDNNIPIIQQTTNNNNNFIENRLRELGSQRLLPANHVKYLYKLAAEGFNPEVIYDVGSCVLHWTNEAKRIWPNSKYYVFEAMTVCEFLYKEAGLEYEIGLLSDVDGREIDFYENQVHPGGNSYYRENPEASPGALEFFTDSHRKVYNSKTIDTIVAKRGFRLPSLLKMDVQGAELDVLKGATNTLSMVTDVILELQRIEYNKGAPMRETVIEYMDSIGFDCLGIFCDNGPDGDYHFRRRKP